MASSRDIEGLADCAAEKWKLLMVDDEQISELCLERGNDLHCFRSCFFADDYEQLLDVFPSVAQDYFDGFSEGGRLVNQGQQDGC